MRGATWQNIRGAAVAPTISRSRYATATGNWPTWRHRRRLILEGRIQKVQETAEEKLEDAKKNMQEDPRRALEQATKALELIEEEEALRDWRERYG